MSGVGSISCAGRTIYHGFLCGPAYAPFLVAVGRGLLLWVGDRWSKNGQVRKFGDEVAPPYSGPQPVALTLKFNRMWRLAKPAVACRVQRRVSSHLRAAEVC